MKDPGADVLDLLFERMQIDEQWSVRGNREFSWWPDRQRQRAWASITSDHHGEPSSLVHIETDVTTGVPDPRPALDTISWMNRSSMLSALVLDDTRIRLHAAVEVTAGNLAFASELALHAMALQLVESSFAADTLTAKQCGRRDETQHPSSGPRPEPDEMLGLGGLYADPNHTRPAIDFDRLTRSPERCWERAEADADSFSAELALDGAGIPELVRMVKRAEGLDAAVVQATTAESHPAIGAGLLLAIRMPETPDDGAAVANLLNASALVAAPAHALGAWWFAKEYGLTQSAFYPALAFRNDRPDWNYRLFESLVWHASSTAQWARRVLDPGRPS